MPSGNRDALFEAMNRAFPEALVEWPGEFEATVPRLVNAKDRHVVAAAIFAHAEVLVTSDRPLIHELEGGKEIIETQTPAVFIAYAIDTDVRRAGRALVDMAQRRWLERADRVEVTEVRDRLAVWARKELGDAVADLILRPEFMPSIE